VSTEVGGEATRDEIGIPGVDADRPDPVIAVGKGDESNLQKKVRPGSKRPFSGNSTYHLRVSTREVLAGSSRGVDLSLRCGQRGCSRASQASAGEAGRLTTPQAFSADGCAVCRSHCSPVSRASYARFSKELTAASRSRTMTNQRRGVAKLRVHVSRCARHFSICIERVHLILQLFRPRAAVNHLSRLNLRITQRLPSAIENWPMPETRRII
jgi:hypothetical protein